MTKRQYKRECARQRAEIRLLNAEIADLCRVRDMAMRHLSETRLDLEAVKRVQVRHNLEVLAWENRYRSLLSEVVHFVSVRSPQAHAIEVPVEIVMKLLEQSKGARKAPSVG